MERAVLEIWFVKIYLILHFWTRYKCVPLMRCLYLHHSRALLRGLLPWPPRSCLEKLSSFFIVFLPGRKWRKSCSQTIFPFRKVRESFSLGHFPRGDTGTASLPLSPVSRPLREAQPLSLLLLVGDLGMWVSVGTLIPLPCRHYPFPQLFSVLVQTHIRHSRPDYLRFLKISGQSVWSSLLCQCRYLCL